MPTLTLDLPETAYRDALTFAPEERIRLASIVFATARSVDLALEPDYNHETNQADLEAIGRGIQAEADGEIIPGDEVLARLRQQLKQP